MSDLLITICKRFTFDAAHRLDRLPPEHKCHRMHGHTYAVEVSVLGTPDENGFVMDYADIEAAWQPLHDLLDHRVLNDVPGLEIPTTEVLVAWIITKLARALGRQGPGNRYCFLHRVRVFESSTTWCEATIW